MAPDRVETSHALEFAGVVPVEVPTLAIEQHLAEKLHAYTRRYAGGAPSSRVKDLVDMVVIAQTTSIDGDRLLPSVRAIFERRATHDIPESLAPPPTDWQRPWRSLVAYLPAPAELNDGFAEANAFWDRVLARQVAGSRWHPDRASWRLNRAGESSSSWRDRRRA